MPKISWCKLAEDAEVREFALKALADRKPENGSLPIALFENGLKDANPRVRLQAIIGLDAASAKRRSHKVLLPLVCGCRSNRIAYRHSGAHLFFQAVDICLAALDQENAKVIRGAYCRSCNRCTTRKSSMDFSSLTTNQAANRTVLFQALCRLYYKEADWNGKWWGTRPDTRGPYFTPVAWSETPRIAEKLKKSFADATTEEIDAPCTAELNRYRIDLPDVTATLVKLGARPENRRAIVDVFAARKQIPAEAIPFLAEIVAGPAKGTPADKEMRTQGGVEGTLSRRGQPRKSPRRSAAGIRTAW